MIVRIWRGWTSRANAQAYETLLREDIIPGIALADSCKQVARKVIIG